MSYILRKVGNATNIAVNQYEADTELDMRDINVQEAPMGSRCYVINTGAWYVLNDKGEWKVVPKKIESNLFLVHLIQGEMGSDGYPTYTVDKTFAEIKTAYDAGKKVELIPPVDDPFFSEIVGSAPFEVVVISPEGIKFRSIGTSSAGVASIPPWLLGGIPFGTIYVIISPDEKVSVEFPFSIDVDTGMPVWNMIQKLPQQYVVSVIDMTDGTLSANNTLTELNSVGQVYSFAIDMNGSASINATYHGKLYYMSGATPTSVTFAATTENGLETLTVSNDGKEGSEDVWTHEVVPLSGDNSFKVTLTSKVSGGYDIDKTFNEVVKAYNDNKYIYALFQNKNNFEFLSLDKFLVPGVEGYALIAFSNEHRYIAFRFSGGSALMYDKSRSSDMTILRGGDAMPPIPVTTADNGKFLRVVDGAWAAAEITNANEVSF